MNGGLPDSSNEYWSEELSAHPYVDERPTRTILPPDWSLVDPIAGEVSRTLKNMQNTTPGLDKLLPEHLKYMKAVALAGYFNLFLRIQGCPIHLCRSSITLVPKVNNPSSPTELMPIAVSSTLICCFHKIVADRWNTRLQLPTIQFAFLHRDGCLKANSLFHALLRNSRTTSSSLCAAFIDVSKVFDSVSQDSIIRSAQAFVTPPPPKHYIADYCRNASATPDGSVLRSQRGFRQGDSVFQEMRVPTVSSFIKPDVIAVCDGAAVVLDVRIVDDYRSQIAWTDKVAKPRTDFHNAAIQSVLQTLGCDVNSVSHSPDYFFSRHHVSLFM